MVPIIPSFLRKPLRFARPFSSQKRLEKRAFRREREVKELIPKIEQLSIGRQRLVEAGDIQGWTTSFNRNHAMVQRVADDNHTATKNDFVVARRMQKSCQDALENLTMAERKTATMLEEPIRLLTEVQGRVRNDIEQMRIRSAEIAQGITSVRRFFSTTSARRSAIQAEAVAYDLRKDVWELEHGFEELNKLLKKLEKATEERGDIAKKITSVVSYLCSMYPKIFEKLKAAHRSKMLVAQYVSDTINDMVRELRLAVQKGFPQQRAVALEREMQALLQMTVTELRDIAGMADIVARQQRKLSG